MKHKPKYYRGGIVPPYKPHPDYPAILSSGELRTLSYNPVPDFVKMRAAIELVVDAYIRVKNSKP